MRATEFDAWFLDLDGVVYIGPELLPGVQETLARWRRAGKLVRFLTNDPRPTREELATRLRSLGVEADASEIVTCGWATGRLLPTIGVQRVFVVGSSGLAEELQRAGLTVVQDGSLPDAVVVGADERLSFLDVVRGAVLVQRGARFIATNNDPSYPLPIGTVPATGAVVCAIRLATGRRPLVVGKPEPLMFRLARETLPAGATALVIGDRMESDILGAHRAGFPAILVASSAFAMPRPGDPRRPDAVVRSLADLFERPPDLPVRVPSTDQWPERVVAGVVLLLVDETRGTLALLPSDGGWQLPWTSLEPLETLEGAAWRLVHHLLQGSAAHLEWVGAVSDTEAVLLRGADGELVHVVGSCFRAAVHQSADTDRVRWHALDSLVEVLPGERVTWIMRRLAPHQ